MNYLAAASTVVLAFILPIAICVILIVKNKSYLKPIIIGACTFFIFQIVLRIPLLQIISTIPQVQLFFSSNIILNILFLSLTAALFEEIGRVVMIKLFIKKEQLQYKNAIAFGLGHGGIEAVLLVGINYIIFFIVPSLALLTATPLSLFLAGAERVFTIPLHILFSVFAVLCVKNKNPLFLLFAIILHTLFNYVVIYLAQVVGMDILLVEVMLFVLCVTSISATIYLKNLFNKRFN